MLHLGSLRWQETVDGDEDEHDELLDVWILLVAERDLLLGDVGEVVLAQLLERLVSIGRHSGDVRPEHLLLDLVDFEANLLAVWRVHHEALQGGPCLERGWIPLFSNCSEGIDKAAEDQAALDLLFLRLAQVRYLIEGAHTDLPEDLVDLLERLRGAIDRLRNVGAASAGPLKRASVVVLALRSVAGGSMLPDGREVAHSHAVASERGALCDVIRDPRGRFIEIRLSAVWRSSLRLVRGDNRI